MRKKNLLILILLLNTECVFAQKLQIGLHVGAGLSQLSNYKTIKEDVWGADWLRSPIAGLEFTYYMGKRFGLSLEANYAQKGNARYTVESKYHYLHFPAFFKVDLSSPKRKVFSLAAKLGFYGARLERQTWSEKNIPTLTLLQFNLKELRPITQFDYGFSLGLNASFRLDENIALTMELRGERGFVDMLSEYTANTEKPTVNKSGWAILGLTYTIKSPYQKSKAGK